MKKYLSLFILLVWLIIIFFLSSMPAEESGIKSKMLLVRSVNIINVISNKKISLNNISLLHSYFRKLIHVFVYYILSILLLLALNNYKNNYKLYLFVILLGVIYAISDEYHQTLVIGRCGRMLDIVIDSLGIILGIISYYIYNKVKSLLKA